MSPPSATTAIQRSAYGPAGGPLQLLHHREVHPQDVGEVGVGLAQCDHQVEELLGGQSPTTQVTSQARGTDTVRPDEVHPELRRLVPTVVEAAAVVRVDTSEQVRDYVGVRGAVWCAHRGVQGHAV